MVRSRPSSRLTASRQNLACNIPVYPYPGEGLYAYMTFLTTCASLLEWFRTQLLDAPEEGFYAQYDQKLTELRDQPASVFALPYSQGRVPRRWISERRGCLRV